MTSTNDLFQDKELGISNENTPCNSSINSTKQERHGKDEEKYTLEVDQDQANALENGPIQEENLESNPTKSRKENITALLQVLGGFFLMFNSWGLANTFGAFQTYYEGAFLSDESPSNISWIGSIQAFLLLFVGGLCSGPIYDAGYLRELVLWGSILAILGMMMTSICTEYWQVVLAQGISVGIGAGCMLLPGVAVMPQYFTTRRSFATGISAAGSSLGGVVFPIVFHKLQPRIGFGWATRVLAFIMLATLLIPITVMRAKSFPSSKRPLVDLKVFRNIPWVLFSVGEFFGFMGMYIPFYYISSYGFSKGVVSENTSFYLLSIINSASIFGRILPSFFSDLLGPLNITAPLTFACAIVAFSWTSISSVGPIVVFCIFYGFFSGTFVSNTGPALASLSTDLSLVGTHMGMSFTIGGLGLLLGNPVAGLLLDKYGWIGPAAWCGSSNILAAIFVVAARLYKTGGQVMVKA